MARFTLALSVLLFVATGFIVEPVQARTIRGETLSTRDGNANVIGLSAAQAARSVKAKRQDVNTLDAADASMGVGGEVIPFDSAKTARVRRQVQKRQEVNTLDAAEASMGLGGEVVPFDSGKTAQTKRQLQARDSHSKRQDINTFDAALPAMGIAGEVVPFDAAKTAGRAKARRALEDEELHLRSTIELSLGSAAKRSPIMKEIRKRGLEFDMARLRARASANEESVDASEDNEAIC